MTLALLWQALVLKKSQTFLFLVFSVFLGEEFFAEMGIDWYHRLSIVAMAYHAA
jgi:hypothetical protein